MTPASTATAADRTELAARLRLVITRTARRLRQRAGAELTPSQSSALVTIERFGPLTPAELADRERFQRPTATRVIARLEERGLVTRTQNPADRRSCRVAVSGEGTALLEVVRGRRTTYLAERLATLDAEELATLDRAAGILERALESEDRA